MGRNRTRLTPVADAAAVLDLRFPAAQAARTTRDSEMAKRCEICDKGPVVGRTVSHAHNVGPRRFEPNLQTVRAVVNGATRRIRVCTRCIRSKKVVKAA
jgi:large subunit ribosomal protein L28